MIMLFGRRHRITERRDAPSLYEHDSNTSPYLLLSFILEPNNSLAQASDRPFSSDRPRCRPTSSSFPTSFKKKSHFCSARSSLKLGSLARHLVRECKSCGICVVFALVTPCDMHKNTNVAVDKYTPTRRQFVNNFVIRTSIQPSNHFVLVHWAEVVNIQAL